MTTKFSQKLAGVEIATFSIQFLLPIGSNDTFTVLQSAPFGFTINKAYYQTASGTITANIQIGGVSVDGLNALAVTSTEGNTSALDTAAKIVAIGDKVTAITTANSTGTMISLCIECTKTEI